MNLLGLLYAGCAVGVWGNYFIRRLVPVKMTANSLERGPRGTGWSFIVFALENPLTLAFLLEVVPLLVLFQSGVEVTVTTFLQAIFLPVFLLVVVILNLIFDSWSQDWGDLERDMKLSKKLIVFKDKSFEQAYGTKKIPFATAIDAFFNDRIDFPDVYETVQHRYSLFRFNFCWEHVKSFAADILGKALGHDHGADIADVTGVYNRGNDFYNWFMGDTMLYSCAMYQDPKETVELAQARKLHAIAEMAQFEKGMKHLDMGCGWGTLLAHIGKHYETDSLGITLSTEQAKYCRARVKAAGCDKNAKIKVINFWDLPQGDQLTEKYDRITCLEMSEHIGIRHYNRFLQAVRGMLKDDGIFYLQIAGLRRAWQYEDLVWGLFMGRYIFPGADASCPLAWDVQQVERAGFEVHRVHNMGCHYALTIKAWYDRWVKNRKIVTAKYGEWWWRMWSIFLSWSACIAFQGSSTVWMIVLRKQTRNDKWSVTVPKGGVQPAVSRVGMSVGQMRIGVREAEDEPTKKRKPIWEYHGSGIANEATTFDRSSAQHIEDEVAAPEDQAMTPVQMMLMALTTIVGAAGAASAFANREKLIARLPGFGPALLSLFACYSFRYFFAYLMRPIFYPILRAGPKPGLRVQNMGQAVFRFIYFTLMVIWGWKLLSRTKFLPRTLGGSGNLMNATNRRPLGGDLLSYFLIQFGFYAQEGLYAFFHTEEKGAYMNLLRAKIVGVLMLTSFLDDTAHLVCCVLFMHDLGDLFASLVGSLVETSADSLTMLVLNVLLATFGYTRLYVFGMTVLPMTMNLSTGPLLGGKGLFVLLAGLAVNNVLQFLVYVRSCVQILMGQPITSSLIGTMPNVKSKSS